MESKYGESGLVEVENRSNETYVTPGGIVIAANQKLRIPRSDYDQVLPMDKIGTLVPVLSQSN